MPWTISTPEKPVCAVANMRFNLSHRRSAGAFIEDLLAERGITVSREAIRLWFIEFGAMYTPVEAKASGLWRTLFIDEVLVKINARLYCL